MQGLWRTGKTGNLHIADIRNGGFIRQAGD